MQSLTGFHYLLYLRRFLAALVLFQLSRLLFYAMNPTTLDGPLPELLLAALRYDLTALSILLLPVLALHIFPMPINNHRSWQAMVSALLLPATGISLLLNCVDAAWFPYTRKRSTADLFSLMATGDDLSNNILNYLTDFWYVAVCWLALMWLLVRSEQKNRQAVAAFSRTNFSTGRPLTRMAGIVLFTALAVVGFRGGLQMKPLSVQAAARMVPEAAIPLVLNTPYTIMKSLGEPALPDPDFITLEAARKIFPVERTIHPVPNTPPKNLVLLILESFSSEYISYYHPQKKTTPFLDSLMRNSDCWPNTFANAKRSIEGIPAILASLPHLMDQPFINSVYNITNINSPASLLRPKGYTSGFFHGGNNGTMGFDNFTRLCGYQQYFGRKEYRGPQKDYDGSWGISDHAFLHFMVERLNTWEEPFNAAFFSLSSHHPYFIPEDYRSRIPPDFTPIEKGIRYTDYSLSNFFAEAKKQPWYANTVFIITADHSGPAARPYTAGRMGAFQVPLIIVRPDTSAPRMHPEIAQQTDILPTALYLCGYEGRVSAFGRNLYESKEGWSVNYANQSWSIITGKFTLLFDGASITQVFRHSDSLLTRNLLPQAEAWPEVQSSALLLKAILKQYNHGLLHNVLITPHEKTTPAD